MVTKTVESLHRFNFMLKVGTSPIVDVLIDELQQQLDISRNLGTNLGKIFGVHISFISNHSTPD